MSYLHLVRSGWQTPVMRENLNTLLSRRASDRYHVNHQGKLVSAGALRRLLGWAFPSYKTQQDRRVCQAIDAVVRALPLNKVHTDEHNGLLKTLFFERLASLPLEQYSRSIPADTCALLKSQANYTAGTFKDEVSFSLQLGMYRRLGANSNSGSYIVFKVDSSGGDGGVPIAEPLAIFKPSSEESLSKHNPLWRQQLKRKLYSLWPFRFILKGNASRDLEGNGYLAEAATMVVSDKISEAIRAFFTRYPAHPLSSPSSRAILERIMREGLVPDTQVLNLKMPQNRFVRMKGSAQSWMNPKKGEKVRSAADFLKFGMFYDAPERLMREDKLPKEALDLVIILDLLIRNKDRHAENILISYDTDDLSSPVKGVHAIDHGASWGYALPDRQHILDLRNRYRWRDLPQCQRRGFTDFGSFIIGYLSDPKHYVPMREGVAQFYEDNGSTKSLDGRLRGMDESRVLLQACVHESVDRPGRKPRSLRDMSSARTNVQVKAVLHQYRPVPTEADPAPKSQPVYFRRSARI